LNSRICMAGLLCLWLGSLTWAQKWERLGPAGGTVVSLGLGTAGAVYVGAADGHVFASEDAGTHWELRGRVGTRTDGVIARLTSETGATGRMFAAVWYQEAGAGGGVFRSEDGGRTWKPSGLQGEAIRALEIAPSNPQEFVAGTASGVFRSNDAGNSWERISPEDDEEIRRLDSVAIDPRDGNVIYAGTFHLPWKTRDGGKTWKPVIAGLIDDSDIMSLRVDATNPERVYLSACSGIYRSENHGEAWTKLQGIPYAARRTQAIVQDPEQPNTLYAATTEGLWVTRDAGESWKRTIPKEWVIDGVVVLRGAHGQHGRVVVGTEGQGILISDDAGETFAASNAGFTHRVVSQLAGDPRQSEHLLILVRTGGAKLMESRDAGATWAPMPLTKSGTEKENELKAETVERVYGSPWGWLIRLRSGQLWLWNVEAAAWREWKLRLAQGPKSISKGASVSKKPTAPTTLQVRADSLQFAGGDLLVITSEGLVRCRPGGSCLRLKAFTNARGARAVWVSANGQVLAVIDDWKLGRSGDGGLTAVWSDLPVPSAAVIWIDTATTAEGSSLFLGTNQGLFESKDAGGHWEHRESGLPAGQLGNLLKASTLWMATLREGGMYASRDAGKTWERVDHDAERGRIMGIVETGAGLFAIGSQSEGVLRFSALGN
jgi:photosystem II stability/assembly factor-like uncharacterized protein